MHTRNWFILVFPSFELMRFSLKKEKLQHKMRYFSRSALTTGVSKRERERAESRLDRKSWRVERREKRHSSTRDGKERIEPRIGLHEKRRTNTREGRRG